MSVSSSPRRSCGDIIRDGIYPLDELSRRLGLGRAALRHARRSGLKVHRIGRRGYVVGRDLLRFLDSTDSQRSGVGRD